MIDYCCIVELFFRLCGFRFWFEDFTCYMEWCLMLIIDVGDLSDDCCLFRFVCGYDVACWFGYFAVIIVILLF